MGMGMGMGGGGTSFTIDGKAFDPDRVDQAVTVGDVEEWTLLNTSPMDHPFHLHVWPMQVLREGTYAPEEVTWRDVVNIPAHGSTVVRIPFDRHTGRTVYHCHILDHEDLGIMGLIQTT
jgi:FtsP/CotA-like multicopper oxidase with cupredoxin domain